MIWVGSNDGLFHVTRDNGANWTNITPPDLPEGGRVQFLEPSPHRAGSAYYAVHRFLLGDYHPYIYRTDDYGASWTLLTDGTNGIPADWPTRVVREDPDREGLLYAGTEFGLFISFDNGAHWQSFQQNLPNVPSGRPEGVPEGPDRGHPGAGLLDPGQRVGPPSDRRRTMPPPTCTSTLPGTATGPGTERLLWARRSSTTWRPSRRAPSPSRSWMPKGNLVNSYSSGSGAAPAAGAGGTPRRP